MGGLASFDRLGYERYLQSPEWHAIRRARLDRDGHRCGCGSTERLEAHHLTYDRLGHERLEDLVTLCHICHAREHRRTPDVGPVAGPTDGTLTAMIRAREETASAAQAAALGSRLAALIAEVLEVQRLGASAGLITPKRRRALRQARYGISIATRSFDECPADERLAS